MQTFDPSPEQVTAIAHSLRVLHRLEIQETNAMLDADYKAWQAGRFCERVLHPQRISVLRQATCEQLEARRIYIARTTGRGYRAEHLNIGRVLREHAAQTMELAYQKEFALWLEQQAEREVSQ